MLQLGSGEYYTMTFPEIILYTLSNNCAKFGGFVHFVPKSSQITTKKMASGCACNNTYLSRINETLKSHS